MESLSVVVVVFIFGLGLHWTFLVILSATGTFPCHIFSNIRYNHAVITDGIWSCRCCFAPNKLPATCLRSSSTLLLNYSPQTFTLLNPLCSSDKSETGAIVSECACVTVYQNIREGISAYHLLMCKLLCRAVLQVISRSEEPWMDKSVPAWGTLGSQGWLEAPNPGWLS